MTLVLGRPSAPTPVDTELEDESEGRGNWGQEVSEFRQKAVAASPVESEEDTLSYFAKLAEED